MVFYRIFDISESAFYLNDVLKRQKKIMRPVPSKKIIGQCVNIEVNLEIIIFKLIIILYFYFFFYIAVR